MVSVARDREGVDRKRQLNRTAEPAGEQPRLKHVLRGQPDVGRAEALDRLTGPDMVREQSRARCQDGLWLWHLKADPLLVLPSRQPQPVRLHGEGALVAIKQGD